VGCEKNKFEKNVATKKHVLFEVPKCADSSIPNEDKRQAGPELPEELEAGPKREWPPFLLQLSLGLGGWGGSVQHDQEHNTERQVDPGHCQRYIVPLSQLLVQAGSYGPGHRTTQQHHQRQPNVQLVRSMPALKILGHYPFI
jgi:hypothetical protein